MANNQTTNVAQVKVEERLGKRVTTDGETPMDRLHRMSRQMRQANAGDAVQTAVPVAGDTLIVTATKLASNQYLIAVTTNSVALLCDEYRTDDAREYERLCDIIGDGVTRLLTLGGVTAEGESQNISL